MKPKLDFWFDFASTYSYLSAMRIDALAATQGVDVRWRPFLLGPIFKAQGWSTSPFNLFAAKGRYMVRDIGRIAAARGVTFRMPDPFPQASLLAARTALAIDEEPARARFCRAVFEAEFAGGRPIDAPATIADCLGKAGLDRAATVAAAGSDAVKARLRAETEAAMERGVFGAPAFVTADGELFWGDDRLEQALAWSP